MADVTTPDPALLLARDVLARHHDEYAAKAGTEKARKMQQAYAASWRSGEKDASLAIANALTLIHETTELAAAYIQSPEGIPSHIFPDVVSALRTNRHLEKGSTDEA